MERISNKSILEYKDYRSFLSSKFLALKAEKKKTSLESMARRIGVSKSFFRFVLIGKRHLMLDILPKISKAFGLERAEYQALIYMVCRDTCRDKEASDFFQNILAGMKDKGVLSYLKENLETDKSDGLFGNWLSMVIHSLAKQSKFKADVEWIKSRLANKNITSEKINEALNYLIESKSLVRDKQGHWKTAGFVFNKPEANVLDGFKIYQVGLSAMKPVTEMPELYRPVSFHMMTLSFDEKNVARTGEILSECRNALIALSQETKDPTHVVFLSLNSACLAKPAE